MYYQLRRPLVTFHQKSGNGKGLQRNTGFKCLSVCYSVLDYNSIMNCTLNVKQYNQQIGRVQYLYIKQTCQLNTHTNNVYSAGRNKDRTHMLTFSMLCEYSKRTKINSIIR